MDMYKYAAQNKLRFAYKGCLSVEDLFGLPIEALDKIYNDLMVQVNKSSYSLLDVNKDNEETQVKIDIVKDIVADKKALLEAKKDEAVKAAKKEQILEALAARQTADLNAKSEDELKKMLDEL